MEKIFVKPAAPELRVRRPEANHQVLAPAGEHVPRDSYWLRRLREGDVVLAEPPVAVPAEPKKPKSSKE